MLLRQTAQSAAYDSLAGYTGPALIVPQLREPDTAGVIKELSQTLHEEGCVPDVLAFYHAALNHEFLVNSATGCGIAFPHARLNGVAQARFAFGRAPAPIIWGGRPSQPVQLVFLLAVPATDAAEFLQVLSGLARLGEQESLLAGLRSQSSVEGILQLLKQVKLRRA